MEYRIMDTHQAKDLIRRNWIPQTYRPMIDEMYFFGLYDNNNKIIAVAVFSDSDGESMFVSLKYIYVREDCRNKGYARGLFEYAKKCFSDIHIREIESEAIVLIDSAGTLSKFMTALGFEADYLDRDVLRFRRGHFQTDNTKKLFANVSKLGFDIERIDNYKDIRIRRFMEQKDITGIYISEDNYVPDWCVFALIANKIEAALCIKRYTSDSVVFSGFYASDKIKDKDFVLPFLMSVMADRVREGYPEIIDAYAVFAKGYRKNAIEKVYGGSEESFFQQRYKIKLQ